MPPRSFRFIMLSAFTFQGGIERFNRALLHAFYLLSKQHPFAITASAVYDERLFTQHYFPNQQLDVFHANRFFFLLKESVRMFKKDVLILGHLNLAPLGLISKCFWPSKPLFLICHGIEVFIPLKGLKRSILRKADKILAVSQHTKDQLVHLQGIPEERILVFPNTLDPFFQLAKEFDKPDYLKKRYQIQENEKVLLTLTRMNSREGYKGYDLVLNILPALIKKGHNVRYVLAGKADEAEKNRISSLIKKLKLEPFVTVTGFVQEEEIADHYLLADLFVMPSKGEGFGIVFLEAMACGREVVAGNKDGSTEALQFGKLGALIDPDNQDELLQAVEQKLVNPRDPLLIQQQMLEHFSFDQFKKRTASVFLANTYT